MTHLYKPSMNLQNAILMEIQKSNLALLQRIHKDLMDSQTPVEPYDVMVERYLCSMDDVDICNESDAVNDKDDKVGSLYYNVFSNFTKKNNGFDKDSCGGNGVGDGGGDGDGDGTGDENNIDTILNRIHINGQNLYAQELDGGSVFDDKNNKQEMTVRLVDNTFYYVEQKPDGVVFDHQGCNVGVNRNNKVILN